jgi:hypothetical protein
MISQFASGTPVWVWFILLALVALGVSQARARSVAASRLMVLPAVMSALSLAGTVSAVGASIGVLAGWLLGGASVFTLVALRRAPAGVRRDPATGRFEIPASWVPLALMMAIFAVRYAVGATLAISPGLAHEAGFALAVAVVYGALGGLFSGRSARILRSRGASRGERPSLDPAAAAGA